MMAESPAPYEPMPRPAGALASLLPPRMEPQAREVRGRKTWETLIPVPSPLDFFRLLTAADPLPPSFQVVPL